MLKSIAKRIGSRDLTPGLAFTLVFTASGYEYPSRVIAATKNQIVYSTPECEMIASDGVVTENIQVLSRESEGGASYWITESYGERVFFRAAH